VFRRPAVVSARAQGPIVNLATNIVVRIEVCRVKKFTHTVTGSSNRRLHCTFESSNKRIIRLVAHNETGVARASADNFI
jgi:hypothetical protein